ncbi:proline dehydrogenase family protein [Maribacter sp. 2-571]|uniref:proline dehydrogenase family protein n=1 Tax=Maribacter sp. 2-571 TaxID=3417569 RepID=UPI003D325FA0
MEQIFEDTATAFSLKTDSELERAYFLFKMIANEPLVRIGTAMTNFALKARLPVDGLIRATVFDHFCGGVNETDCMPVVDKLWSKHVCSVLDYSVEGKDDEDPLDNTLAMVLKVLDFVKEKAAIPFAVFKPTGYGRFALFKKIGEGKELNIEEAAEWDRVVDRFDRTCKKAYDLDVSLLIDAEESWMQDAADTLVEQMMRKYNRKKAIVFNTLQLYRWDRMAYLEQLHKKAKDDGFKIGMKAVRGAYMEKENERAERKGYASPICGSKAESDANFDRAITYMADHLDVFSIFAGTHNEASTYRLMELMDARGIPSDDTRIWFGQLYGMSDHISFNLADKGYNVAKYLPFGPVRDVMPYLIRRAEENTSVAGQTTRELNLLKKERKRRGI